MCAIVNPNIHYIGRAYIHNLPILDTKLKDLDKENIKNFFNIYIEYILLNDYENIKNKDFKLDKSIPLYLMIYNFIDNNYNLDEEQINKWKKIFDLNIKYENFISRKQQLYNSLSDGDKRNFKKSNIINKYNKINNFYNKYKIIWEGRNQNNKEEYIRKKKNI